MEGFCQDPAEGLNQSRVRVYPQGENACYQIENILTRKGVSTGEYSLLRSRNIVLYSSNPHLVGVVVVAAAPTVWQRQYK